MNLATIFSHITGAELFSVILGILLVWVLKYSKEKDKSDDKSESFSFKAWLYNWFSKRNDNILSHLIFSFCALYIGVDNLQAWMGEQLSLPSGVDEIGAAFIIGFAGSYAVEILKKAL